MREELRYLRIRLKSGQSTHPASLCSAPLSRGEFGRSSQALTLLRGVARTTKSGESGCVPASGRLFLVAALLWLAQPAAGQWVEPPGQGWVQVGFYYHNTRNGFDAQGNRERVFTTDGRSITTSLYLTGAVGVVRGLDAWVAVPYHWFQFNDIFDERDRVGIGDPRLHLRVGPELFGRRWPVPVTVRAGVKLPAGEYTRDAEIIPLTEGQRDWEVVLELGHSFWPRPVYVMGWLGYRWRETNEDAARKPGNERFFLLAAGGTARAFSWKLTAEGLFGETPELLGLPVGSARRRLVQLLPSVGHRLGPGNLEVGGRFPVLGRNLPAGPALFIGYFFKWGQ